ncbi:unnamed protein product [Spirodela intermedia]|uniref:Uncharacterized protein n=2 Tax=Spirodela intermedia TaxID=51605 RepID=A0A7I8J807_SPIIN|nr:unnamed protein product [Spirodela intermedia]CAA6666219.1 unnamed protein product [Spirodela intermedia]CAA7402996.1 unnamed protein product [Spirodela intermedia]
MKIVVEDFSFYKENIGFWRYNYPHNYISFCSFLCY